MGRPRTTAVLLPLCLLLTTCSEQDPCFRLETPEDYLACPDLCGDEAPTSIQCHSVVPSFPSGVYRCDTDLLGERTDPIDPEDPRFSGYWIMGESSPGFVEIVGLPVRGVPTTRPVGQLRSTDEVPALPYSKMSLYYRYFTGSGRCVIEIGSVMSWDFLPRADAAFAINFERSSMIMKRNSHCSTYSSLILEPGYAWKETDEIYKRSGSRCVNGSGDDDDDDAGIDIPPNFCVEDGWCNPACDNDPDCEIPT